MPSPSSHGPERLIASREAVALSPFWRRFGAFVREQRAFVGAVLRSPATVGAICPSSRALARAMIAGSKLRDAEVVVELGPGTGVFTRAILEAIGPATEFFALELDSGAVDHLRATFPVLKVFQESAERIREHLQALGRRHADYVISGLPWAILTESLQDRIMDEVASALAPGGVFTTFAYLHARGGTAARRYWRRLPRQFSRVELSRPVWRNIPPAVVYRCVK